MTKSEETPKPAPPAVSVIKTFERTEHLTSKPLKHNPELSALKKAFEDGVLAMAEFIEVYNKKGPQE